MSTATSVANRPATEQILQCFALGWTPGLGPTRVRHRVQHFGSVAAIFRAALTELEATGLPSQRSPLELASRANWPRKN